MLPLEARLLGRVAKQIGAVVKNLRAVVVGQAVGRALGIALLLNLAVLYILLIPHF
jgi:hypothetical protein